MESLKPINKYIDKLREDSHEHEHLCEKVEEHYLEVDEALVGKENFTQENLFNADMRRAIYWDYIKGETSWDEFVDNINVYSNKLLINID